MYWLDNFFFLLCTLISGPDAHVPACVSSHLSSLSIFDEYHRPNKEKFERKIVIIFLPINLNQSSGCSKEPSH